MRQSLSKGPMLKGTSVLIVPLTIVLCVTGCGAFTRETTPNSDCCIHLSPIYFSNEDTPETQEQVIDYLIVYEELCGALDGD